MVNALYPGANAETVLRSVAPSLEESINGVENMTYMSSTASNDGTLSIAVYFTLGTDPDQAAINVQNRVSQALSHLPAEVVQQGITTSKQHVTFMMGIGLYTEDESRYDQTFVGNYAEINIIPELKRIPGVGLASLYGGQKDYSMRVWLNPAQMTAHQITPNEVMRAIQDKSLEAAPGKFGQHSKEVFEYVIKYKGKLTRPEEYENIPVRSNADGSMLRLKDVARVELGAFSYNSLTRLSGKKGVVIGILQLSGANSNETQIAVRKAMEKASKAFPKGIKHEIFFSTKIALDQSIAQVKDTLIEAFILVFIVVFLFLQDFRSTLIPAIAVPVAILGTFFFMHLFGFSINLLTLFALILAIGIVVDDAIVVVEAVHAKMEHKHLSPKAATHEAMHEISGAIISITLVMAAVFLPVGSMEGSTGLFYRQFAFTMAIAIVISAVNALTLSPALAALFLKDNHTTPAHGEGEPVKRSFKEKFFIGFNSSFNAITTRYVGGLKFLIAHKWLSMGGLALVALVTVFMVRSTPSAFIPTEDQGFIAIAVNTPSGTTLDGTQKVMSQAETTLKKMDAVRFVTAISGFDVLTNSMSPSKAIIYILLKPNKERGKLKNLDAIMDEARNKLSGITGGSFFVFSFPTVPGFSNVEALDMVLQDKTGGKLDKFSDIAQQFIKELMKRPEIAVAFTSFKADYPQLQLDIDDDKADQLGVHVKDILETMQAYFGSAQASDFNRFGKYYRVMVQADITDRADPSSIDRVFVKNKSGEMVPINTLVKLSRVYGSETVSRYNMFNSISINAIPKPGFSSGAAIKAVEEVAEKQLPVGYSYEFSGQTREEIASGGQSTIIFLLCLVFVYFLLAAQYESYILPLAVILSLPAGIFGVFVAIGLTGIANSIYVQVALIMLIGLLAKNAILIVEFAVQRRKAGQSLVAAALEAAKLRIRPIIMTSLAFVVGLFPMSIATGPSAQGNHAISIGAAGGMVSGVLLGLFFIPVLFVIFQHLQEKVSGIKVEKISGKVKNVSGGLILLLMMSACNVSRNIETPKPALPIAFRNAEVAIDTNSVADIQWKTFFTDPFLQKLIDSAIQNNYDMQIALKNIESSQLLFKQIKLNYMPQANLAITANTNRPSENSLNGLTLGQFLGTNHIEDYSMNLTLSWEADIWGKIHNQGKAALAQYLQTAEARKAIQTNIVSAVSQGYYNLLMLDEQLGIAQRNVVLNDSTLRIIRLQFRAGQVSSLAVQQAEAQQLAAAQLVPGFEQNIVIQENALRILTSALPGSIERSTRLNQLSVIENIPAGLPSEMLSRRPDVRSAELALDIANGNVGFNKANMYPVLNITAAGGVTSFKASNWFNIPASLFGAVAGSFLQPVFNRKKLKTQYEVSKIEREKVVLQFRQSVLNAVGEVSDALVKIEKLKAAQAIVANRVNTLQQAIGNATLLFKNGMANYLEVIIAQSNVLQSELELAAIKRQQLSAIAVLYRSLGGGWK
jgi:HAE1 family hydrophobic/amphiphilic exporter-1